MIFLKRKKHFFQQIEWFLDDSFNTSFIELAFLFWDCDYRFEAANTPADIATLLRKCVNQASKMNHSQCLVPGKTSPKAKSNGKTFPAGIVTGCVPRIHDSTLKKIAVEFFNGRTQHLKDWKFLLYFVVSSHIFI